MINDKADEFIEEIFGLEISMKVGDFACDCVHLLHYKYIDYPD